MPKFYQIKITNMWYKVNQLTSKGLKIGQISLLLGAHRDTVRRYRNMSESEMHRQVERPYQNRKKKLSDYSGYVAEVLKGAPYLTSPQILDRLKETYPDLPQVSDKTVYNFVTALRQSLDLPVEKEEIRQMVKLPDPDYGKEAQVDWGEKFMKATTGHWKKVYFFTMVMSRSRQKFVYFQDIPFTARMTAYAHHLAFIYFGGVPETIVYDQDAVLLVCENLGDYRMTADMEAIRKSAGFTAVFCRPADPQSKGKVENVVGYVKNHFIKGRIFSTLENLNKEVLGWLERTGNGHRHATTRLIPSEEFVKEQQFLLAYSGIMEAPQSNARPYVVRRDNTISYRGCFYSMPIGTYAGDHTRVMVVEPSDKEIEVYSYDTNQFLISYAVSTIKGRHITKPELSRTSKADPLEHETALRGLFREDRDIQALDGYLSELKEAKPRYYSASVNVLFRLFSQLTEAMRGKMLGHMVRNNIQNAYDAVDIANALLVRSGQPRLKDSPSRYGKRGRREQSVNVEPMKTDIAEYDRLIESVS